MPKIEVINEKYVEFDGHAFRKTSGGYYDRCESLHGAIYEKFYGIKIPKEYSIHHVDGDKNNNDVSNLQMLTRSEHQKKHTACQFKTKKKFVCIVCGKEYEAINNGHNCFCSSKCRDKWSTIKYPRRAKEKECLYCGNKFESYNKNAKYCSQSCRAKDFASKRKRDEKGIFRSDERLTGQQHMQN